MCLVYFAVRVQIAVNCLRVGVHVAQRRQRAVPVEDCHSNTVSHAHTQAEKGVRSGRLTGRVVSSEAVRVLSPGTKEGVSLDVVDRVKVFCGSSDVLHDVVFGGARGSSETVFSLKTSQSALKSDNRRRQREH